MFRITLAIVFSLLSICTSAAAPSVEGKTAENIAFFEKRIRPILSQHCYECHSAGSAKLKGGLALDSEAGWMDGGDSGEVIIAGDPASSLLIKAITHEDGDLQMPPKYKLTDDEINALTRWVKLGAPDPRDGTVSMKRPDTNIDIAAGRNFWAFQKPTAHPLPIVKNQAWARDPIDFYVLAELEARGLTPAADAERGTLIRR